MPSRRCAKCTRQSSGGRSGGTMRGILLLALAAVPLGAAGMRVGVARVDITPRGPIWMSGYASRNHPSEGVRQNLWARALVIEAAPGGRVAIVTTDLVGLPAEVTTEVAARARRGVGARAAPFVFAPPPPPAPAGGSAGVGRPCPPPPPPRRPSCAI